MACFLCDGCGLRPPCLARPTLISSHGSTVYTLCCARSLPRSAVPKNGELMASSAAKLCRHLAPAAQQGRSLDIWREIGMMTMDVVGSCAFGEHLSVPGDVDGLPAEPWGRLAARHLRQSWLRPIGLSPASCTWVGVCKPASGDASLLPHDDSLFRGGLQHP